MTEMWIDPQGDIVIGIAATVVPFTPENISAVAFDTKAELRDAGYTLRSRVLQDPTVCQILIEIQA